jgi:hypothetical protein
MKGLDIIVLPHAGIIHEERGLDCLFCCGSLLSELVECVRLIKDTPGGSWKHVPDSSLTATSHDSTADVSSTSHTEPALSKLSKSARRRNRRNQIGKAASDGATIDQSKADTGYSDVVIQTNPVSPSLLPNQLPSSSIMSPATVFDFAPTSVPDGINASTQTEIPPSESLQELTEEYIRHNDEIVEQAMVIAKRYRDLFVSNQDDQRTISSLREKNRELFEHNVNIFASHEALLASHHRYTSEIARSADDNDLMPPQTH